MSYVMTVKEFLKQLNLVLSKKSLYVMGGWGFPLTASNKDRTQSQPYNRQSDRKKLIYNASSDTFAWDCVGLTKGVLWGWTGDTSQKNGGATYGKNGVMDYDAKEMMFKGCTEQSKDFSKIEAGEFLWLDGHCGVYIGDGLAMESTPKWKDGVQVTAVLNIGSKSGYNGRTWTYHGHLKYVDYSVKPQPQPTYDYEVGETYKVLCDELEVRDGAGTNYKSVGKLKHGAEIKCKALKKDSSGNTWMQGEKGWSAAIYNGNTYIGYIGWVEKDGKKYYYSESGKLLTNRWLKSKGRKFYAGSDGAMLAGWQTIDGKKYYFYEDCHMAQDEWIDNLFLNMDGTQTYTATGSWKSDDKGKWYQDTTGWYPRSRYVRIDKKNYKFKADGYLS